MSRVSVELTTNVARAVLGDIAQAESKGAYAGNKGWTWWAYDSSDKSYSFGGGVVTVVQRPTLGSWEKTEGDTEVVFEFMPDDVEDALYFRVTGEYTSYNGDLWDDSTFRQVRPTAVVRRVFEAVK
jgi:hypothetical protein